MNVSDERMIEQLHTELLHTEQAADKLRDELNAGYVKLDAAGIGFTDDDGVWLPIADRVERLCAVLAQARADLADARRVARLWFHRAKEAILAQHNLDLKVGLERQAVQAERQARQEAEQRAECAEALIASIRETVRWLWGFYDGNTLVAKPGYEDDIREAWDRLLIAATDGKVTTDLLDRLEKAEALAAILTEVYAMLNCSPEHPWHGCTAQEYSNEDHYMCHSREARELLEKVLEGKKPTSMYAECLKCDRYVSTEAPGASGGKGR